MFLYKLYLRNESYFLFHKFGCLQCAENNELQEKVNILEQRLASFTVDKSSASSEQCTSEEYADELKKKVQTQVITGVF